VSNRCQEKGHFIKDCPQRKPRHGQGEGKSRSNDGSNPAGRGIPDDYVCKICNQPGHWIQQCPDKEKHPLVIPPAHLANMRYAHVVYVCWVVVSRPSRRERAPTNAECWFCLASSGVATHLIVSVGEENYIALPKGGLSESHVLVLPITHVTASPDLTDAGLAEMEKFKLALRQFYDTTGEVV
jgi:hypothetical protein